MARWERIAWTPILAARAMAGKVIPQMRRSWIAKTSRGAERRVLSWAPRALVLISKSRLLARHTLGSPANAALSELWRIGTAPGLRCVSLSPTRSFLATADGGGRIRVFRYPLECAGGASFTLAMAHSSPVAALCWSADEQRLLSVGTDRVMVLWRVCRSEDAPHI